MTPEKAAEHIRSEIGLATGTFDERHSGDRMTWASLPCGVWVVFDPSRLRHGWPKLKTLTRQLVKTVDTFADQEGDQ